MGLRILKWDEERRFFWLVLLIPMTKLFLSENLESIPERLGNESKDQGDVMKKP